MELPKYCYGSKIPKYMKNYKATNLSILIPAFDENKNLSILLPKIKLEVKVRNYEIIVVDGYLHDRKTYLVCKKNNAVYCQRKNNNSYGEAIREGINKARGHYIIIMDADFSHSPKFINSMFLKNNFDVVIASRYINDGGTENPYHLILLSRILNYLYSKILSLKIKDISNSFRLYRADKLKNIITFCNNFDVVEEIIYKLSKKYKNLKIIEIPYVFKKRKFGRSKRTLIFAITYFITLIKLRFSK
jgi:dolichol-phosphate mannosyltransferase